MNSFSAQFSAEIRAHVAKNQLKIEELQGLLAVSRSHAYKLLNGKAEWSVSEAIKTAAWAGISLDRFIENPKGISA